jgi:succinylglutamate desuccinylase
MVDSDQREKDLLFFQKRNNIELEYAFEMDSGVPGPHVIICGAIHGHEPVGVEAIKDLTEFLESNPDNFKKGKITGFIGNPEGYLNNIRLIDENMNRSFTPELSHNIEGRRAQDIRVYFESLKQFDYLLDLHSVSSGNFQSAVFIADEPDNLYRSVELSALDMQFGIRDWQLPGGLINEATKFGAYGYAIECGGNDYLEESLQVALWHIYKLLSDENMIGCPDEKHINHVKPSEHVTYVNCIEPIRPQETFRWKNPEITSGTKIKKGEVYAFLEDGTEYIAEQDCEAFMPDKNPQPNDHDVGFLVLKEVVHRNNIHHLINKL